MRNFRTLRSTQSHMNGVKWISGPIQVWRLSLLVLGFDLEPSEVTRLLGLQPTRQQKKGEKLFSKDNSHFRIARTGSWTLDYDTTKPVESLEVDIEEFLEFFGKNGSKLTKLSSRFETKMTCEIYSSPDLSQGFVLGHPLIQKLANLQVDLWFDVNIERQETGAGQETGTGPTT